MPQNPKYLDKREIAEFYEVSAKTIERWMKEKRIAFWRTPGGAPRFDVPSPEAKVSE